MTSDDPKKEACSLLLSGVPSISVEELKEKMKEGAVLIDVRQPEEFEEASIEGSTLIPLNELPARLVEIPAADEIYVHCKSGGRSSKAVAFLRDHEVNAINVAGGIKAWLAMEAS